MNVRQLKELLEQFDDGVLVVISRDEEGNGYNELYQIETNAVYNKSEGEVHLHHLTPQLIKEGFTEEDLGEGEIAIVLYP
jgi:hypothetical protein